MNPPERLEPPALGVEPTPEQIAADLRAWRNDSVLVDLVARFDGPRPSADGLDLAELLAWSARSWDFRAGRERNLVDPDVVSGSLEAEVVEAAQLLGLVDPVPPRFRHYDFVLMLGGLVRACVWRPEYTAHLLRSGVTADAVYAVSGFRELNAAEVELLPTFGLEGLRQEHQVMDRALQTHFGAREMQDVVSIDPADEPNLRKRVALGATASGLPVGLVVAPSRDATRRANTPDSYFYWAHDVAHVAAGQRVLMVTSTIYVPFQHTDAVRMLGLPHGCVIDTVGIDTAKIDERGESQEFRGVNYLQELNSTIRSLKLLADTLAEPAS